MKTYPGLALKSLLSLASLIPGYQSFLEKEVDPRAVSVAGLPGLIRGLARNPVTGYLLPRVAGVDVLEIDDAGNLRSLINPKSPYNGLPAGSIERIRSVLPILLLDRDVGRVFIETPGPVLLTKAHGNQSVISSSVVLACGEGTMDVSQVHAPVLVRDRDLTVEHVTADTYVTDLSQVLSVARLVMLKTLRGEPLAELADRTTASFGPRPSLIGLLWKTMSCTTTWRSVNCRWSLPRADVQALVDRFAPSSTTVKRLRLGLYTFDVDVSNARALVEGDQVGVRFDLGLSAPSGQGPLNTLLSNPVTIKDVTARTGGVTYDRASGALKFSEPTVTDLALPFTDDPILKTVVMSAVNVALRGWYKRSPEFSFRSLRVLGLPLSWFVRQLRVSDDRLHLHAGLGRCDEALSGVTPPD